ncbi:flagellar export chaperone FliS [Niallia circulans]|jgi:flagellar secretion chaperone FliS|uniref:flagellar export chaperone FliS n=1 Tax=Niallia circulans TaxID=1397 RepID=UPI00077C1FF9|nr:flagellar export chaperone FliS [Niallia circulans]MDR4316325.1 flagellar export chaperone FliS [Niallia circulans]MED3838505.1 flagellar export chaperone FliS [Niallia circulans]MED4243978.1 flagellar export chaperone FliS [Niallia circulans]MED4246372.1 flagellar export chaperone FliS [Niallia circulans]PAD25287.1 flagellar export chaperone FliS [Niallia circulans]
MANLISEEVLYQKSPQELTALLYEACLNNLEEAIENIENKDYILANVKLKKANDIVWRLGAGINYEAGIIADQLDMLYNYIAGKLIDANLKKDISIIQEVKTIIEELLAAWTVSMKEKTPKINTGLRQKTLAYEKNIMTYDKN